MKTMTLFVASVAGFAGVASAEVAQPSTGLASPFDNAVVSVEWIGSNAGYTGELTWFSPFEGEASAFLFNNKQSVKGSSVSLAHTFNAGEQVVFQYEVIKGGLDTFRSDTDPDQFRSTALSETEYLIGIEDIRLPRGDADYNDVEVRVSFAAVPSPGSLALLGAGMLCYRRRR